MSELRVIDDLTFEVRRSDRRKTIGITVDRDGSLILHVPQSCALEQAEQYARDKRFWVYTKLAEKKALAQPARPREFVTGEGFYYLGRSYRLLVYDPDPNRAFTPPLRFFQSRFMLRRDARFDAREHFTTWYTVHARSWITERVALFADRVEAAPRGVNITDLGARWGSCGAGGTLNFHWRAILLPPHIVEYVVVHELVHLLEPAHGEAFWDRLERAIPDFAAREQWLSEHGALYVL